jgi:hypothetical protein
MKIAITPGTCVSSGLGAGPRETGCREVVLDSSAVEAGAQGAVFPVAAIDGTAVGRDYVAKLFHGRAPAAIGGIVKTMAGSRRIDTLKAIHGLRGFPLFLFSGADPAGRAVSGYVSKRCPGVTLSRVLDEQFVDLLRAPLHVKVLLAYELARAIDALHSLTIVHADINGQNLLIDLARPALSVIDIDGGAAITTGAAPVVIGKWDPGWLAPEIIARLAQSTSSTADVTLGVDRWAAACGIHYLLFGVSPFFFIQDRVNIPDYLARYSWPVVSGVTGIPLANQHAWAYYANAVNSVAPLHGLMRATFQHGYQNPARRATAYQWTQVLRPLTTGAVPVRPRPAQPAASRAWPATAQPVPAAARPVAPQAKAQPARPPGPRVRLRYGKLAAMLVCAVGLSLAGAFYLVAAPGEASPARVAGASPVAAPSRPVPPSVPPASEPAARVNSPGVPSRAPNPPVSGSVGPNARPPVPPPMIVAVRLNRLPVTLAPSVRIAPPPATAAVTFVAPFALTEVTVKVGDAVLLWRPGGAFSLPAGRHRVVFLADALFLRHEMDLELTAGSRRTIALPRVVDVQINAIENFGAVVSIDGREVGETPLSKVRVAEGPHTFRFVWPHLKPQGCSVSCAPLEISFVQTVSLGRTAVTAAPPGRRN